MYAKTPPFSDVILAAFKMEKAIGPDGRPVETDFKYYDLIR